MNRPHTLEPFEDFKFSRDEDMLEVAVDDELRRLGLRTNSKQFDALLDLIRNQSARVSVVLFLAVCEQLPQSSFVASLRKLANLDSRAYEDIGAEFGYSRQAIANKKAQVVEVLGVVRMTIERYLNGLPPLPHQSSNTPQTNVAEQLGFNFSSSEPPARLPSSD